MSTQRIIQCIGLSEEDTAHLRLLLRVTRTELRDVWTWGSESRAHLVVVNPLRLMGDAAMRRALQREIPCAQVIEASDPKPSSLFLRKPFSREDFVKLLNRIGHGSLVTLELDSWTDEFFDLDLGGVDLSHLERDHPSTQEDDPDADAGDSDVDPDLAGTMPPGSSPSGSQDRGEVRVEFLDELTADDEMAMSLDSALEPLIDAPVEEAIDENAAFPLVYYLERGLLGEPARIALRGVPSLLLDPNEQTFWARGSLPGLEPYAREPLRYGDWHRMDKVEFEEAKRGIALRPFARLIWMDSFIHSNGFLARHFDPGGTFRLVKRLDLSLDYPRAFRVGSHMTTARKLHEVARVSAVGLAEVFDVVNAYEAIGYVEWTPRESPPPRPAPAAAPAPLPAKGKKSSR